MFLNLYQNYKKEKSANQEQQIKVYHKIIFMQSFIKFQSMVPKIQMKRAKRDIHTYLHTANQVRESE